MNAEIAESYRDCKRISRQAASNFYWSFSLLPRQQRLAMYALYAFSRCTDDLGDSSEPVERRREQLAAWRQSLAAALDHRFDGPLWPALIDTVERFVIPCEYLYAIVDGVAMDLEPPCYATFDDLRDYCYHVASAVGLACIHIWGYRDERATELADACGVAFQMTNILRDLREDASSGRIYLPRHELARFECNPSDLRSSSLNERLTELLHFQIERTELLYAEAAPLAAMISRPSRHAFVAMFATYRELLAEIKRRDGDVFSARVRLGGWRHARILCAALMRPTATRFAQTHSTTAEGDTGGTLGERAIPEPTSSKARKPVAHEQLRQTGG